MGRRKNPRLEDGGASCAGGRFAVINGKERKKSKSERPAISSQPKLMVAAGPLNKKYQKMSSRKVVKKGTPDVLDRRDKPEIQERPDCFRDVYYYGNYFKNKNQNPDNRDFCLIILNPAIFQR